MEWTNVALRFALYVDLMLLFGVPAFALHALRGAERSGAVAARFIQLVRGAAGLGLLLSLGSLVLMAKEMTGAETFAELELHVFQILVAGTDYGLAWAVRMAALVLVLFGSFLATKRGTLQFAVLTGAGAIALGGLAWTGHGAMDEGVRRVLHLGTDMLHLLAAGTWFGALVSFVLLAALDTRGVDDRMRLLGRTAVGFAAVGTGVVVVLMLTGVVNYLLISGWVWPSVRTLYVRLLAVKVAIFCGMLLLAAANRWRLSPRLAIATGSDRLAALHALRSSLFFESSCAVAILVLVAWIGTLSPDAGP